MSLLRIIGMVIGITAIVLAWEWFGWKLSLVIILAIYGNNLEQLKNK